MNVLSTRRRYATLAGHSAAPLTGPRAAAWPDDSDMVRVLTDGRRAAVRNTDQYITAAVAVMSRGHQPMIQHSVTSR